MLRFKNLVFLLAIGIAGYSQIPTGYYSSAVGLKKSSLKTALHLKIKNATVLGYGGGDGKTWSGFVQTDVRPADGSVWDMYSNVIRQFNGTASVTDMNIEHSFAKSWWGGTETQAYKDLHHLNPSDATANQRKSAFVMSVIDSTVTYANGVIKVGKTKQKSGYLLSAWEPADEYKGDFARVYMYMVTAYEDYAPLWTADSENQLDNNTYPVFEKWAIDLLLQWSRQDPVSSKEINRNNVIYGIQGNRNPYIDFPLMAEYVWGNRISIPFTENGTVSFPYLNYPDNNDSITTPVVYVQRPTKFTVPIKANNLTGALSFSLSGTNISNFSLSRSSISKTEAEAGTELTITVSGQQAGLKTANLNVSGGGITALTVKLKTEISDAFVALPATNIRTTGFDANWTIANGATGYELGVFSLRPNGSFQSETKVDEEFLITIPNTWTREGYTDQATASNFKLGSTSTYGKLSLEPMDFSQYGARITVKARQYSTDNGAKLTFTANNVEQAAWTTSTVNQTFTIDIPCKTAQTVLAFSAIAGKRVYIDYLKVEALIPIMYRIYESGYPKSVGNITTYSVTGLITDSSYYFTSKPQGIANPTETNVIKAHTDLTTGKTSSFQKNNTFWSVNGKALTIKNISQNSQLILINSAGQVIQEQQCINPEATIQLPKSGIYLLKIRNKNGTEIIKVCR